MIGGPVGAGIGGAIGGVGGLILPNYVQEYGEMRDNQKEVGQEDIGKAALGAIPAAGMETLGDVLIGGKFMPKPIKQAVGKLGATALEEGAGLGARSMHAGKDALKGAAIEGPATSRLIRQRRTRNKC
jgi:hypothetical protein